MQIDDLDKRIIIALQKDGKRSLTSVAREVRMSIDGVHSRIKKMISAEIIKPSLIIDPSKIGYPVTYNINVKLNDKDESVMVGFREYMYKNPRVINISTITGVYDLSFTIIAKDGNDYSDIRSNIRKKLSKIILEWKDNQVLKTFVNQKFDMEKL